MNITAGGRVSGLSITQLLSAWLRCRWLQLGGLQSTVAPLGDLNYRGQAREHRYWGLQLGHWCTSIYLHHIQRKRIIRVPSLECWNQLLVLLDFKNLWRCLNTISPAEIKALVHKDLYCWAVWGIIITNITTCQCRFSKYQCTKYTKCQNWGTLTDTLPAQATSSTSQNDSLLCWWF